jgi:hypothetical protein
MARSNFLKMLTAIPSPLILRKQQELAEAQSRLAYEYWQQIAQDVTQSEQERLASPCGFVETAASNPDRQHSRPCQRWSHQDDEMVTHTCS